MTNKEFYDKWIENFACGVAERDLERYVVSTGNLLWHVFSWELHDKSSYLEGDEAKRAYDTADKGGAIYVEWFENDCPKAIPYEFYRANALDELTEVYAVGRNFDWTYIKTHESSCGPYFMSLK